MPNFQQFSIEFINRWNIMKQIVRKLLGEIERLIRKKNSTNGRRTITMIGPSTMKRKTNASGEKAKTSNRRWFLVGIERDRLRKSIKRNRLVQSTNNRSRKIAMVQPPWRENQIQENKGKFESKMKQTHENVLNIRWAQMK